MATQDGLLSEADIQKIENAMGAIRLIRNHYASGEPGQNLIQEILTMLRAGDRLVCQNVADAIDCAKPHERRPGSSASFRKQGGVMVWGKRRFAFADFAPYQDRLEKLLLANAQRYAQFIMVSTKVDARESDYYVGVPDKVLLALFDGFEPVEESALPKLIDVLLIADTSTDEFKSRFQFRHKV